MKTVLTVGEALLAFNAIGIIGANEAGFNCSMKITRNKRALREVAEAYEEKRSKTHNKFREKTDQGKKEIPPEKMEDFNMAIKKLQDEKVELELESFSIHEWRPAPENHEGKYEPQIAPNILDPLTWMFTECHVEQ